MAEVSVVIPNYNRSDLLVKAIRSALCQTVPVLEVLVCDDGSTDNCEAAVRALKDGRVRWLPGPRGGCPAIPRNRGIAESRGDWVAFLDNDDEWLPEKLERELALAERLGCRAACANALRLVPGKGTTGRYLSFGRERIAFDDLLSVNLVICSSALLHRSLFERVAGFPEDEGLRALEDYALWLRVATLTDFAFDAEPMLIYRDDAAGSIRGAGVSVWSQRKAVFADFVAWDETRGLGDEYRAKVGKRLWQDRVDRITRGLIDPVIRFKKSVLP